MTFPHFEALPNGYNTVIESLSGTLTTMTYDYENRLQMQVQPGNFVSSYVYDGSGLKRLEMEYNGLTTIIWDGPDYVGMQIVNDSAFVSQLVPSSMTAGHHYEVAVKFSNTGLAPWTGERNYSIMSMDPEQNDYWGLTVYTMPYGDIAPVGTEYTFTFTVTAPTTPGTYPFAWNCLCEVGAFGPTSTEIEIAVS